MTNKFVSTTALQITLFEDLLKLDIIPDGIIGHSFGEIACDRCRDKGFLLAVFRNKFTSPEILLNQL